MKIGTKSVLFGAHCFFIHPWFVAWGWRVLYGFPWDPRLWTAFFVHDIGYLGKPNMDGKDGEQHPELGALIMHFLFDRPNCNCFGNHYSNHSCCWRWYDFVKYHSRYLAKLDGVRYSRLCIADKLAITLTPAWLYLPMTRATGEIHEYMKDAVRAHPDMAVDLTSQRAWYKSVQEYCRKWGANHKDGREDTWTSERREPINKEGVWR